LKYSKNKKSPLTGAERILIMICPVCGCTENNRLFKGNTIFVCKNGHKHEDGKVIEPTEKPIYTFKNKRCHGCGVSFEIAERYLVTINFSRGYLCAECKARFENGEIQFR
jgi:hypothetical protein